MNPFGKRATSTAAAATTLKVVQGGQSASGASAAKGVAPSPTDLIRDQVLLKIEPAVAVRMSEGDLSTTVVALVSEIATDLKLLLNRQEQQSLAHEIVDDMIGLGPLEPLLRDNTVSDILINGANMVYVERRGKLELTDVRFRHNAHVLHVAQRTVRGVAPLTPPGSPRQAGRKPQKLASSPAGAKP